MLDLPAILKQAEAATDLTMWAITAREEGFCVGNGRGYNVAPHVRNQADAELFVHARTNILLLVAALEEAQETLGTVREAWGFVEDVIVDSDTHTRHAPGECDFCDAIWAMLMVIRDAILGESK